MVHAKQTACNRNRDCLPVQEYEWEANLMGVARYATAAGLCRRSMLCR